MLGVLNSKSKGPVQKHHWDGLTIKRMNKDLIAKQNCQEKVTETRGRRLRKS